MICARFLKDYDLNFYESQSIIDIIGFPYMNAFCFFSPLFLNYEILKNSLGIIFNVGGGMKISYLDSVKIQYIFFHLTNTSIKKF